MVTAMMNVTKITNGGDSGTVMIMIMMIPRYGGSMMVSPHQSFHRHAGNAHNNIAEDFIVGTLTGRIWEAGVWVVVKSVVDTYMGDSAVE